MTSETCIFLDSTNGIPPIEVRMYPAKEGRGGPFTTIEIRAGSSVIKFFCQGSDDFARAFAMKLTTETLMAEHVVEPENQS